MHTDNSVNRYIHRNIKRGETHTHKHTSFWQVNSVLLVLYWQIYSSPVSLADVTYLSRHSGAYTHIQRENHNCTLISTPTEQLQYIPLQPIQIHKYLPLISCLKIKLNVKMSQNGWVKTENLSQGEAIGCNRFVGRERMISECYIYHYWDKLTSYCDTYFRSNHSALQKRGQTRKKVPRVVKRINTSRLTQVRCRLQCKKIKGAGNEKDFIGLDKAKKTGWRGDDEVRDRRKKATDFGCDEMGGGVLKISSHQCFMSQITFPSSMASSLKNILLTRICVCMCVCKRENKTVQCRRFGGREGEYWGWCKKKMCMKQREIL